MLQPGNNLLLPRGTSRSPNQWLTHATKGCLEGGRLYPNRHALSRANWGCLKGTIWTTRRWGRREQGSCRMPDRQRGSIPASPAEPLSTYSARVSRGWRNPRWLSRVGLQAPGKITTTNPRSDYWLQPAPRMLAHTTTLYNAAGSAAAAPMIATAAIGCKPMLAGFDERFKPLDQVGHLRSIVDLRQLMRLRNLLNAALPLPIECREVGMSGTQDGVA